MPDISSDEQNLLTWQDNLLVVFEYARAKGPLGGTTRGRFREFGLKLIHSGDALIPLPATLFAVTRSAAQQGFNRYFLGQNINTPQFVPGIRPNSNYRVMVDEKGYFVLLDFDHPECWEQWKAYCIERHGVSAYSTEYGTENTLASITSTADANTRDLVLDEEAVTA